MNNSKSINNLTDVTNQIIENGNNTGKLITPLSETDSWLSLIFIDYIPMMFLATTGIPFAIAATITPTAAQRI